MSRVQLSFNVTDLDAAVAFYSRLFGTAPAKLRPGYANFAIEDPPLKLVLNSPGNGPGGTINHLGVEVSSSEEVTSAGTPIAETVFEPRVGGGIVDRAADGSECRWARILAFDRDFLAFAIVNLVHALLMLGDWDTAEEELTQAADSDRLADHQFLTCHQGWLAALHGDAATAETILGALQDLRASEDPQDKALVSTVEAFTAATRGQPQDALRQARAALDQAGALGISHEALHWAWPLAARSARELDDTSATSELIALLDAYKPGRITPMQRAERDLALARLAARDGDPAAAASFAAAITGLRELSTPYHLAHGLLDYAQHLAGLHDADAAQAATGEACDIARNLRCQPLLDRAANITPAKSPAQA